MQDKLQALFTSRVRIKILRLFILNQKEYYVRQICREIDEEINAVRRELKRLNRIGFLSSKTKGNRLYYMLQRGFPLYPELVRMIAKETGLGRAIIDHKEEIGSIRHAMLALPFVHGRASSERDVDLLIVGRVRLRTLSDLIHSVEEKYEQEINYSVLTVEEFELRKRRKDAFIQKVLSQPQIMLIGDEEEFNE